MKSFLKYLGPILLLIGTVILAVYYFHNTAANTMLIVAGVLMVVGLISHVVINKYIDK